MVACAAPASNAALSNVQPRSSTFLIPLDHSAQAASMSGHERWLRPCPVLSRTIRAASVFGSFDTPVFYPS